MRNGAFLLALYGVPIVLFTYSNYSYDWRLPALAMAGLTCIVYVVFTLVWLKTSAAHYVEQGLFVLMTLYMLLTLGDELMFQREPRVAYQLLVLAVVVLLVVLYRQQKRKVDALAAALLILLFYIAMNHDGAILPYGTAIGLALMLPFLLVATAKQLIVTQTVARIGFFFFAWIIIIFVPATPFIAEAGFLLYALLLVVLIAYLARRKLPFLLPANATAILLVVVLVMYGLKWVG